ncbi:Uncharacterized protein HZ326_31081 [Fusarium oxysporum f. sp. albedinis]|nr:Uncharacterized protein HZ326_31081 [Fusarium oxysporum f. sp. albedinis]
MAQLGLDYMPPAFREFLLWRCWKMQEPLRRPLSEAPQVLLKPCRKPIWVCRIASDIGEAAIAHKIPPAGTLPVHHLCSSMLTSVNRPLPATRTFKPTTRRARLIVLALGGNCCSCLHRALVDAALTTACGLYA